MSFGVIDDHQDVLMTLGRLCERPHMVMLMMGRRMRGGGGGFWDCVALVPGGTTGKKRPGSLHPYRARGV